MDTKVVLLTLFAYVMVGHHLRYHLTVCMCVLVIFHLLMHSVALIVPFPTITHNNICDYTASLLSKVYHELMTLRLNLTINFTKNLRYKTEICCGGPCLDISAAGFWGDHHRHAFLIFMYLIPQLH